MNTSKRSLRLSPKIFISLTYPLRETKAERWNKTAKVKKFKPDLYLLFILFTFLADSLLIKRLQRPHENKILFSSFKSFQIR
jgi:hypothetical protein